MAESDASRVLRQPVMADAVRRLPAFSPRGPEPKPAVPADDRQLLAQLRQQFADELAQLREESRQQGLAVARQEAEASLRKLKDDAARQAQQEADKLRQSLTEEQRKLAVLVAGLQEEQARLSQAMAPVIGRLALLVAVKLLGQHQQSRSLVADMVAQALDSYRLQTPIRVHVSASDFERIQQSDEQGGLLDMLVADASLGPGDCLIDHGAGRLEAGLDIQWEALKQALLAAPGADHVADA